MPHPPWQHAFGYRVETPDRVIVISGHIDSRVTKQFLIEDLHRGMKAKFSPACEKPFIPRDPNKPVKPIEHAKLVCYDCGLDCDLEAIKQERIAQRDSLRQFRRMP